MAKSTKAQAKYQPEADECERCTMFRPPDRCTAVEGDIDPDGWCRFFKRKRPTIAETGKK